MAISFNFWSLFLIYCRGGFRGREVCVPLLSFAITLKNYKLCYSKLNPNTIKTFLTPKQLLFGRQLFHSFNTKSTVVRNLTVLSSTTDKISRTRNHFLDKWRHGYVVYSRETQRTSKLNINSLKVNVNNVVLDFYKKVPRHFWRIAIVTRELSSRDSEIRGAIVRIAKTNTNIKRLVYKLFAV